MKTKFNTKSQQELVLTVSNYVTMDNNLGCIEDYYICHGNDRDNNVGVARKI